MGGRRRQRFEDDDLDDDYSEEDEIEDFLTKSDLSDDSDGDLFSDSSPRSFVRRDPLRHRPRRRGGLLRDGGLLSDGGPGRRGHRWGGLDGRDLGGMGGMDRVPGMMGRDRYRIGQFGGSSYDTGDSMYSEDSW